MPPASQPLVSTRQLRQLSLDGHRWAAQGSEGGRGFGLPAAYGWAESKSAAAVAVFESRLREKLAQVEGLWAERS